MDSIHQKIQERQALVKANLVRDFEESDSKLEKGRGVPIGTVNKYGEIKTAQGWVYQKKGTQKAEESKEETKVIPKMPTLEQLQEKIDNSPNGKLVLTDLQRQHYNKLRGEQDEKTSKYQPHEIGEDKNDNRFTETPYDEIVQHSITQVGTPMQYQAEQEMLRRAYKKLGRPATGLSEAIDVLKGSNKKPEQDVTPEKMAQGGRLVSQQLITSKELSTEFTSRVNKEMKRMGVTTYTTKDSERATQTVLSEMQREGKFDKKSPIPAQVHSGQPPKHLPKGEWDVKGDILIHPGGAWGIRIKKGQKLKSDGSGTLSVSDDEGKTWKVRKPPIEDVSTMDFTQYGQHPTQREMWNAVVSNIKS